MKEINQLSLPASSPFSVALSLYLKSLNLSGLDTAMNKAIQLMRTQFRNNRHWPVGLSPLQLRLLHISPPCPRVSNSTLQLHLLPVGVWLFFFLALLVVFLFVCFLVLQVSRDFTIPLRVLDLDDRQGFTARSALRYKKKRRRWWPSRCTFWDWHTCLHGCKQRPHPLRTCHWQHALRVFNTSHFWSSFLPCSLQSAPYLPMAHSHCRS